MTRKDLINAFNTAKDNRLDICVKVTIPGQKECEYIVNKLDSLDNKLEYYCKAYDENCVHSMNDKVKIVDAFPIDFYMGE